MKLNQWINVIYQCFIFSRTRGMQKVYHDEDSQLSVAD